MATRTIDTEIRLMGEKEFNDQMKAINNNLKNLDAELKASASSFDENASATDKLKDRQRILSEQIDQQKEKVRALNEMYEKQKEEQGENSAAADRYRQQMLNAQTALNKMEAELRKTNKELDEAAKAEDKAGDEAKEAAPKLDDAADKIKEVANASEKADSKLPGLAKGLASAAGSAAKFAAVGTAKTLAGLGVAASAASVGVVALATIGLKGLADAAIAAAQSGDPAFAGLAENLTAFEEASTSAKNALGKVLLPALESLSSKGAKLLGGFSRAMEKAGGDTRKQGEVIATYVGKFVAVAAAELPKFVELAGSLIEGLTDGLMEHGDEIGTAAQGILDQLTGFLDEHGEDLGSAAAGLVSALLQFLLTNAPNLIEAGVSMIDSLVEGLDGSQLADTAMELVSTLFNGLIEIAPDLIVAGLELLLRLIEGIVTNFPKIIAAIGELIGAIGQAIEDNAGDLLAIGSNIVNKIKEGLMSAWGAVVEWFQSAVASLNGTAHVNIETHMSSSGRTHGGHAGQFATGLDYVPYDGFLASLHEGEMIVPARLASQLRQAGINRKSTDLSPLQQGGQPTAVQTVTKIEFTGDLAQLARVLNPVITQEQHYLGEAFVT